MRTFNSKVNMNVSLFGNTYIQIDSRLGYHMWQKKETKLELAASMVQFYLKVEVKIYFQIQTGIFSSI